MKHLKRILIVMLALALLAVSAFAVIAADDTDDPVAKLNKYIETIENDSAVKSQSATLRDLYAYHDSMDWSANPSGYAEAMAKAHALAVTVGEKIEDQLVAEETGENNKTTLSDLLELFNTHFLGCSVPEGTAGLSEILAKLEARNMEKLELTYAAYETANTATPRDLDKVRKEIQSLIDQLNEIYPLSNADTVSKYKNAAFSVTEELLDAYLAIPRAGDEITDDLITESIKTLAAKAYMSAEEYAAKYYYFERANDILQIQNLIIAADFDESNELNTLIQTFNTCLAARNAEVAQKAVELDLLSDFDAYELPTYYYKNYDGTLTQEELSKLPKEEQTTYKSQNDLFTAHNARSDHRTALLHETINGVTNGFQSLLYGHGSEITHLYLQPMLNGKAEDHGMVLDFNMRMFENFSTKNSYCMYSVDDSFGTGNSKFYTFLVWDRVGTDGMVFLRNAPYTGTRAEFHGAVELEVWTHYTLTYDADKRIGEFYVNYEKVLDIYYSTDYAMRGFRWGPTTTADFRWDLDEVKIFAGTQFRDTEKFTKMTSGEQFKYYVEYAASTAYPYISRNLAYKKAQVLLPTYENDFSYASTVSLFRSINYEEDIRKNAMVDNFAELEILVKELVGAEALPKFEDLTDEEQAAEKELYPGITVNSSNVGEINEQITKINEFISRNGDLINKGDTSEGGYQDLMTLVYTTQANIKHVENAVAFVAAVERFDRATTLAALTRHALSADQIYTLAGFDDPEIREFIEDDDVVRAFESKYNNTVTLADGTTAVLNAGEALAADGTIVVVADIDPDNPIELEYVALVPEDEEYVSIFEYYDSFTSIMAAREKYENSRRICNCVDYIISLDDYEDTVEFWEANYDTISSYMTIVRNIVRTNEYDPEYVGVDEALEEFWELDVYFYEILQQEHIEYIDEMLARYPVTNAYIEKLSIVGAMQDYFANEDLAITNLNMSDEVKAVVADEIIELERLKLVLEVYSSEIDGLGKTYEDVLEEQTQYFINTVNYMKTLKGYAEIKELYATATTYYYGINVNTEGAPEAIATYNEYRAMLTEAGDNALLFELAVDKIADAEELSGMEKRSAIYAALKECASYYENLDDTSASVKVAITSYNMALSEYIRENAAFNEAIFESEQITNAVRSGKLSPTVLAVISSIIAGN